MKKITLFILFVLFLNTAAAQKPVQSMLVATPFYNSCKSALDNKQAPLSNYCLGYVTGYMKATISLQIWYGLINFDKAKQGCFTNANCLVAFPICLPKAIKLDQIITMIVNYMDANPEKKTEDPSLILYSVLEKNYSCPSK